MTIAMLLIGAFYLFGGVLLLRQMAMDRLMDAALAALGSPVSAAERVQSNVMIAGGVLLVAAGIAAATLSLWAAPLFAAAWLAQAVYLLWAARARAPENEIEAKGRQSTINAFILFTAALAAVLFAQAQGVFRPWPLLGRVVDGPAAIAIELAVLLLAGCATWLIIVRPARLGGGADSSDSGDEFDAAPDFDGDIDDTPSPPFVPPTRIRLAPEFKCWPIWDHETGDNVSPFDLSISNDLLARIEDWDWQFQCQYDEDDPAASGFKDAEHEARWRAEGEAIAAQLRAEWPHDLVVRL